MSLREQAHMTLSWMSMMDCSSMHQIRSMHHYNQIPSQASSVEHLLASFDSSYTGTHDLEVVS
jgi:hypothetical protein